MTNPTDAGLFAELSPDNPASAARALAARWREGDPTDVKLLAACVRELARLRSLWRRRPAGFDGETVALLREIAAALAQPSADAALAVLREAFGYDGFRAGQRRSSTRCWPGATASA